MSGYVSTVMLTHVFLINKNGNLAVSKVALDRF